MYSSTPNQNEQVLQQPNMNYAPQPPSHVAFLATPTAGNGSVQRATEPSR